MNKLTLFLIFCLITGILCGCSGPKCKKSSSKSSKSSSSGCSGKGCGSSGSSSSGCSGGGCSSSGSSSGGCCGGGGSCSSSSSMHGGAMDGTITPEYDAIPLPAHVKNLGIMDSPFYDCKTRSLYFVDLLGANIFRYSEEHKQIYACSLSGAPSFILPIRQNCASSSSSCGCGSSSSSGCSGGGCGSSSSHGCSGGGCGSSSSHGCSGGGCGSSSSNCSSSIGGSNIEDDMFLVGMNKSVVKVQWDGISPTSCQIVGTLTSAEENTSHMTNSAIAGPKGALYFGFLAPHLCGEPPENGFYRWTTKDGLERLLGSYVTTNALAYDNTHDILYHSDGCTHTIRACHVNRKTGEISHCKIIIDNSRFGLPNTVAIVGLAIACNGNLYVDTYGTLKQMFVVSPHGEILQIINMPVEYTGATAWGGCNRDILYTMTSGTGVDILTGQPITTDIPSPGRTLLAFKGLSKGQRGGSKRPCAC